MMRVVEVHGDVLSSKSHSLRSSTTQLLAVNKTMIATIVEKGHLPNLTRDRLKRRIRMFRTVTRTLFRLIALSLVLNLT